MKKISKIIFFFTLLLTGNTVAQVYLFTPSPFHKERWEGNLPLVDTVYRLNLNTGKLNILNGITGYDISVVWDAEQKTLIGHRIFRRKYFLQKHLIITMGEYII